MARRIERLTNQHTYGIPAAQAPVFCLGDTGGEMAVLYVESFERIWLVRRPGSVSSS